MAAIDDVVKVLIKSAATGAAKQQAPKAEDIAAGYLLAKVLGHGSKGAFLSVFLHSKSLNKGESKMLANYWREHHVPRLFCMLALAAGKKPGDTTIGGFVVITKKHEDYSYGQKITSATGYVVYPHDIKSYSSYRNPLGHPGLNRPFISDLTSYGALRKAVDEVVQVVQTAKQK